MFSSGGPSVRFLTRYDGEVSEPLVGWFMTIIYYPTLTVILAWLTARYSLVFVTSCWPNFPLLIPAAEGGCIIGPECMVLTMLFLVCAYVVNALSPKLAGHFQTTTTVIKLIPLFLMAVVGIIVGLVVSPSPLAWRPDFPGAPREAH